MVTCTGVIFGLCYARSLPFTLKEVKKKIEIDMFTHFKCSEIKLYRATVKLLYSYLIHATSFYGANKKHQI